MGTIPPSPGPMFNVAANDADASLSRLCGSSFAHAGWATQSRLAILWAVLSAWPLRAMACPLANLGYVYSYVTVTVRANSIAIAWAISYVNVIANVSAKATSYANVTILPLPNPIFLAAPIPTVSTAAVSRALIVSARLSPSTAIVPLAINGPPESR